MRFENIVYGLAVATVVGGATAAQSPNIRVADGRGTVFGRVTDASSPGRGIPKVRIDASVETAGTTVTTFTDDEGRFRFPIPEGIATLRYFLAGFEMRTVEDVQIPAYTVVQRDIELKPAGPAVGLMEPGTLRGQLGGISRELVDIRVSTTGHPDWTFRSFNDFNDRDKYSIQLPPGRYTVWFIRGGTDREGVVGYATEALENVEIRSGETTIQDVVLRTIPTCSDCARQPDEFNAMYPLVRIETTIGAIDILVDVANAPITGSNFMRLVDAGFYTGGRFHRANRQDNYTETLPNHPLLECIQAGINPARRAETYPPIPLETTEITGKHHVAGTVSMARNAPEPADFFILLNDEPSLDFGGKRFDDRLGAAAFGKVVSGMDVVRSIQRERTSGEHLFPAITILSAKRVR